jgi:hypothetical protein
MRFCAIPRALRFLVLFLGSGLLISCGGGRMSAPKLKEILVAPTNPPIAKGTSVQLTATGLFDDGVTRPLDVAPIWQTSRSSIISVDTQGNVTGVGEGIAQVSALSQGVTGSTTVTVGAAALVSIAVTPAQPALPLGESLQLTATGTFSDGTTQDLTATATWTSSAASVASVTSAGGAGAAAIGTATITATSGTIVGSTSLTVGPAAVVSLNIVPPTLALSLGSSHPVQAIAGMSDGTAQDVTATVTWNSSPATVATVKQGSVVGVGKGSSLLSASYQHATATAAVSVGPPALLSIAVSLSQPSLPVGESEQLTATGKYSDGSVQNLTQSATWSASGSSATVNPAGSVTATAVGATTISATSGSISGSASLTVTGAVATALNITPAALTLSLGTNGTLHAIATMSDGTTQDMTATATWNSTPVAVATVAQGNISSVAKGAAQVSAVYQGLTGNASITVGPPALVSIAVSPNQSSLPLGETEQLVASGTYTDGSVQNLTQSATWTSAAATIATVSASGGVVSKGTGTATISATSGSIVGSASVKVAAPVVVSVNIAPATLAMIVNSNRPLQATATFSDGTTQNVTTTATWTATPPNIATISNAGIVSAMQVGSTTIAAQVGSVTGSDALTVMPLALVSYFNHAAVVQSGLDGTVQIVNPGLDPGNLCAMVYVFDQNQELNECCGCTISDNGMRTLSVTNDLTANPLTGIKPNVGEVRVVPSDPSQNPQCDPANIAPAGALAAWSANPQVQGGGAQITESSFRTVTLTTNEQGFLSNMCSYLEKLGSGKGICSCGTGD